MISNGSTSLAKSADPGAAAMIYLAFASWPLGEFDRAISLVDGGQGWRVAWLASSRALASASAHCWAADGRSRRIAVIADRSRGGCAKSPTAFAANGAPRS